MFIIGLDKCASSVGTASTGLYIIQYKKENKKGVAINIQDFYHIYVCIILHGLGALSGFPRTTARSVWIHSICSNQWATPFRMVVGGSSSSTRSQC